MSAQPSPFELAMESKSGNAVMLFSECQDVRRRAGLPLGIHAPSTAGKCVSQSPVCREQCHPSDRRNSASSGMSLLVSSRICPEAEFSAIRTVKSFSSSRASGTGIRLFVVDSACSAYAAAMSAVAASRRRWSAAALFARQFVKAVVRNGTITTLTTLTPTAISSGSKRSVVIQLGSGLCEAKFPPLVGGSCRGTRILSAEGLSPEFRANKKHPAAATAGCDETKSNR